MDLALQPGSRLHLTWPPCPTGEDLGCGSACGSHSCPEGYCSNGGHCHLHPITCTPTCTCPPAFTDQHCLVAGGDFWPLPSAGGCLCWQGGEPQPCASQPWDARATPAASPWQISPGEVSGCRSERCEMPLLGKSTALYVSGGDRLGEGDALAPRVQWQLWVPVSLCTPLQQDPWGPSGSAGLEGGGTSRVTAAPVLSCLSLTPSCSPTTGLSHPGLPGGKGFPEQHQHHPDVSQMWSAPLPTSGNQQGWAWGHGVWDTKGISPIPESIFLVLMLVNPWRHKPYGTFHLLLHLFTTPKMGKLRHSEPRSLCDAAVAPPAAPSFPSLLAEQRVMVSPSWWCQSLPMTAAALSSSS